jgi:hypothetical protein
LVLAASLHAQPISSLELFTHAADYDGQNVIYEGEAIGDIMIRGPYAWVNVSDGEGAIGIWMQKEFASSIVYSGSYKSRGDWLEIKGVFHNACPQHGGELDIHAESIRKIRTGREISEKLNVSKRNMAFVLLGVLCLVWILKQLNHK